MLVVNRRKKETITLIMPDGTRVIISVQDVRNNSARIGFVAPKSVKIVRTELLKPMTEAETIDETFDRR